MTPMDAYRNICSALTSKCFDSLQEERLLVYEALCELELLQRWARIVVDALKPHAGRERQRTTAQEAEQKGEG